jgi:hypothetical protein
MMNSKQPMIPNISDLLKQNQVNLAGGVIINDKRAQT